MREFYYNHKKYKILLDFFLSFSAIVEEISKERQSRIQMSWWTIHLYSFDWILLEWMQQKVSILSSVCRGKSSARWWCVNWISFSIDWFTASGFEHEQETRIWNCIFACHTFVCVCAVHLCRCQHWRGFSSIFLIIARLGSKSKSQIPN